ncbi:MAG: hypothetical protein ACK5VI_03345 [Opitutia bacterium]
MWETLWTFETARFRITCDVTPEDMDPADSFDDPETIEDIRSGALDWFQARLRVTLDGVELGADYLGGCAYTHCVDFVKGENRNGYFRDMVRQAVSEARRSIGNMPTMRQTA